VTKVELSMDMPADASVAGAIGSVARAGRGWPVFALSKTLSLQSRLPASRRFCACFGSGEGDDALAPVCDEFTVLASDQWQAFQPLPECLQGLAHR